jgi:hypothetical protein
MEQLVKELRAVIAKYPQLKEQVNDFYQLCRDEIEEGGSPDHEMDLCRGSVRELIEEIGGDVSLI